MSHDEDDFPIPVNRDEWTWIDDMQFAFRVTMIVVSAVSAFGLLLWMVMK